MSGNRVDIAKIEQTMQAADIQAVTISSGSNKDAIVTEQRQVTADGSITNTPIDVRFGAASLSKPVFVYLVLNLVGINHFSLDKIKLNDIFPFEKFCEENDIQWDASAENKARIALFTPAMALSHMTGLPIGYNKNNGAIKFDFDPGQGFAYSGIALMYLQKCIEKYFNASLESLAKKNVFDPVGMKDSSFYPKYDLGLIADRERKNGKIYLEATTAGLQYQIIGSDGKLEKNIIPWHKLPINFSKNAEKIIQGKQEYLSALLDQMSEAGHILKANAANSLQTTGNDYVRFCLHWMNNKNDVVQEAFKSKVTMTNDPWAVQANVPGNVLKQLGCGYGWMLEMDAKGKVTSAFHTGDMDEWRSGVKLDFNSRTATVLFTKSKYGNGHLLQEDVFGKSKGLDCFFQKFVFARNINELRPDWRTNPSWGANIQSSKAADNTRPAQIYNKHRTGAGSIKAIAKSFRTPVDRRRDATQPSKQVLPVNQQSEKAERTNSSTPNPFSTRPVPPWGKK